jgi:endogenous inhibitor of DNA gyrase (YacG/DUF329 family)
MYAACPDCGSAVMDEDGSHIDPSKLMDEETRRKCETCQAPLWTLMRPATLSATDQSKAVLRALQRIPTIGAATAKRLVETFGDSFLAQMLGDNLYEFINLMDKKGIAWSELWPTWSSGSAKVVISRANT